MKKITLSDFIEFCKNKNIYYEIYGTIKLKYKIYNKWWWHCFVYHKETDVNELSKYKNIKIIKEQYGTRIYIR